MKRVDINQKGSVLISILIIMPFFLLVAAAYMQFAVTGFQIARKDQYRTHAQFAADAGLDYAMEEINENGSWTGTATELDLHNDGTIRTTYQVSVTDVDSTNKTVTSTGKTYRGSSATPESSISIDMGIRGVVSGEYSIVSGVGGLIMRNSSRIVNGSVYVNGTLTMSNTSQIGLSFLPVDVKVAHQSCPAGSSPGATYPRVCASGENGQPITLNHSSRIYGDVEATNQTNGAGMSNGGLVTGSSVPAVSLPSYDRAGQKAAVTNEITGAQAGCSFGFKTWPANTKITGDVTVSNLCFVTVEGNVWITGNLNVRNLSSLNVRSGLTEPPVIMIDGSTGFTLSNAASLNTNLNLTGFRIITYANATGNPDANVTGTNLYNSQSMPTININNTGSGFNTEFYARWSKVVAGNSGSIGALVGQTVELNNSLAVTFGTSVSGFGDTVWVVDSYKRSFD
ncbi:hypothetical protein HZB74_00115 [Candidatus Saccharibacteria bacterium]|nr:hypothetical protein [Candidatus Saccharibacteria bacterium]